MEAIVGKTFKNRDLEEVNVDKLKEAKLVGLFFSARSCPPSKKFTELLVEFYQEINCDSFKFEIIWISLDSEEEEFKKSLTKIPWIGIPYGDPKIKDIISKYGVTSIPKLIILNSNGGKVTDDGRIDICHKGELAFDKWIKMRQVGSN